MLVMIVLIFLLPRFSHFFLFSPSFSVTSGKSLQLILLVKCCTLPRNSGLSWATCVLMIFAYCIFCGIIAPIQRHFLFQAYMALGGCWWAQEVPSVSSPQRAMCAFNQMTSQNDSMERMMMMDVKWEGWRRAWDNLTINWKADCIRTEKIVGWLPRRFAKPNLNRSNNNHAIWKWFDNCSAWESGKKHNNNQSKEWKEFAQWEFKICCECSREIHSQKNPDIILDSSETAETLWNNNHCTHCLPLK